MSFHWHQMQKCMFLTFTAQTVSKAHYVRMCSFFLLDYFHSSYMCVYFVLQHFLTIIFYNRRFSRSSEDVFLQSFVLNVWSAWRPVGRQASPVRWQLLCLQHVNLSFLCQREPREQPVCHCLQSTCPVAQLWSDHSGCIRIQILKLVLQM